MENKRKKLETNQQFLLTVFILSHTVANFGMHLLTSFCFMLVLSMSS